MKPVLRKFVLLSLAIGAMAFFSACGERAEFLDDSLNIQGPYQVSEGLLFLTDPLGEAVTVSEDGDDQRRLNLDKSEICDTPSFIGTYMEDGKELIVLWCKEDQTVERIDSKGKVETYSLGAPLNGFELDGTGKLVAYMASEAKDADELFVSSGQVAIADLKNPAKEDNPLLIPLSSYGDFPTGVQLSPAFDTAQGERQFAFVKWNAYLSVFDITSQNPVVVAVPLRQAASSAELVPKDLRFDFRDEHLRTYFLATFSNDLLELDLDLTDPSLSLADAAAINLFPMASGPLDFILFNDLDGVLRAYTICSGKKAVLTTPSESLTQVYELPFSPTSITFFDELEGLTTVIRSSTAKSLVVTSLGKLVADDPRASVIIAIPDVVGTLAKLPGQQRLLLTHPTSASVVDMEDASITTLGSTGSIYQTIFNEEDSTFWALTRNGMNLNLVALNLTDLSSRSVLLDEGQDLSMRIFLVDDLVMVYEETYKDLIMVPTDFKDRSDLTSHPIFFADELMDR
jgi:hypothetical protein